MSLRDWFRTRPSMIVVASALAGMLGVGLALGLVHLWSDHQQLHVLVAIELQREQAARSALPPPSPGK